MRRIVPFIQSSSSQPAVHQVVEAWNLRVSASVFLCRDTKWEWLHSGMQWPWELTFFGLAICLTLLEFVGRATLPRELVPWLTTLGLEGQCAE